MRQLILLIILLSICSPCLGQPAKFKDLPEKHWAEAAVYDLVKRGITNGFPDGTYQGMRNMTRYEMASFLAKINETGANMAAAEKLVAELKTELQAAKYERENPDGPKLSAQFEERFRLCNVWLNSSGDHGPRLDYRLKLSAQKNFSSTRYLKINLDTMDGIAQDLATKMIDIEGKTKLGIFDLKAAVGPGTVAHIETDGTVPSDDYYIYIRPKENISVSTTAGNLDLVFSYVTRQVQPWGEVKLSELTGTAAYTYNSLPLTGKTKIALTPRYLWSNGNKDVRGEVQIISTPLPSLTGEILYGIGNTDSSHGLYAKAALTYSGQNTSLAVKAHKVGSDYRQVMDKYEFVSLNNFNKFILDGSVDVGFDLTQKINDRLKFRLLSDAVLTPDGNYGADHPGTSLTNELSVSNDYFSLFYRSYFVPSGISSTDPGMARNISSSSDLIGIVFGIMI